MIFLFVYLIKCLKERINVIFNEFLEICRRVFGIRIIDLG